MIKIEKKKMGRPTNNPKPYRAVVRYDEECKDILEKYCEKKQVNQMEAIRQGIKKLSSEI